MHLNHSNSFFYLYYCYIFCAFKNANKIAFIVDKKLLKSTISSSKPSIKARQEYIY